MPLFISEEEFRNLSDDSGLVAEKADAFIRELYNQIETVKAEAEAASITLEQTCALNEQKYVSLSVEYSSLQLQHSEVNATLEQRTCELGQLQAEKKQLLLQSIEKDGDIERLTREASEHHKSKKQLMELFEQRDLELGEKNASIKGYLDKIVNLTENAASKDAQLADQESELGQLRATSARLLQEKELLERHNSWLNGELTAKVDSLIQLRKEHGELESDMSAKLADVEQKFKESSSSLKFNKDRVRELEDKLTSMGRELLSTKDASAAEEERSSAEISTVNKLVDLYKERSEEWSKKARELEGVIKALETHLNQVESEYKDKLGKEVSLRKEVEQEAADLKDKLQSSNSKLENLKKGSELTHLPLSSSITSLWLKSVDADETVGDDRAIVPTIPSGVSGTALAASLLRDGWTLVKIYSKYQEAVDALQHEQLGRKQAEAVLERVLYEIEEKAGVIMDEREEHERLVESYNALDQKLQQTLSEHTALEITIQELKASLKRQERDYAVAQREIIDLQKQVAVLLKECRDVQLRCGSVALYHDDEPKTGSTLALGAGLNAENIISDRLLTLKDINGLVEQNVQLRSLVRTLTDQIEEKEAELKDKYEKELQMHTDETASKVNTVLQRAEEQARMIESLHTSVAMYKKLYEEEQKRRSYTSHPQETNAEKGSREVVLLQDSTHDTSGKVQELAFGRLKNLEDELTKSKNDIISLRSERDKLALEAQFAVDKLSRFLKEFEHQREELNGLIARNIEFSQLIVDYQKKLRESAESLNAVNERSSKLTMEVSILKHEKEILQNSEKRASDEVRSLTERVHRLQASLDTIHSTEEVREEARGIERRKHEEHINKVEREWAEAKRELLAEQDNFRNLSVERESTLKNALRQVDELSKELANALQSVAAAESRAAVAEARCSDLGKMMESARAKDLDGADGGPSSTEKKLEAFRNEIEKLREEAEASKNHMLQYKSIAQVNEDALKQMELSHEHFRNEADEVKRSLENELHTLRERVSELESECKLKTEEAISATAGKNEALAGALSEIASVKDHYSDKMSQIAMMESNVSALKEDLESEHKKWRTAQDNYERQVILQSETIQELTKTSEALASVQQEASELRKMVDVLITENSELKQKWETEKLAIEVYKSEADKKYSEVDELNKILHSRLEALHIKFAEKERGIAYGSRSYNLTDDDGLQNVVNYLRRSKEIAETEISLLKQEKLRLQSQLDSALKSAESAQTSLQAERAKSRASVLSEEEFKSLQLQIRELNLLRESNVQLRDENRRNFEECQRLREVFQNVKGETENLEKLLRERERELEAYRKEVENLKMERVDLEKRIDELVDRCKDVDIDDYNRIKESFQKMQITLSEKDNQFEEVKKLLAEKQDTVLVLERDIARIKTELNERETRVNDLLQMEASLKSEVERLKRSNLHSRRKTENLAKEKDDLSKEIQDLSKQLEDAKQVKRNIGDTTGEQALREKEKEKDTRIQILERTLERHRDDLKKEKEDHQKEKERSLKIRKTILESRENVTQQKSKLSDELDKHKQALQLLRDEVEKLKNPGGESTSVAQDFSATLLEDFASAYFQAVENFEQVTQPACGGLDSGAPSQDNTAVQAAMSSIQAATSSTQAQGLPATNVPSTRTNEEKERRVALAKANIKTARKLVRPNIVKPKESQGDVDMSEADESNTGLPPHTSTENQGNVTAPTTASLRKRPSASVSSHFQEEMVTSEETGSDVAAPLLKKPKSSETVHDGEEPSDAPTKLSEEVAIDESTDDVAKLQQSNDKEEAVDSEKDEFETGGEPTEDPTGDEQVQVEQLSDAADEKMDKPSESMLSDDQLRDQTEQDIQHIVSEGGDREEGELVADFGDNDGDSNIPNETGGPETGDFQAEQLVDLEKSPITETGLEVGEVDPSQTQEEENIVEGSDKVGDGSDPTDLANAVGEEPSGGSTVDVGSSEQGGPTLPQDTGGKPVSPLNSGSTTINLQERARQRAHLRQAGIVASSPPTRGRGRVIRGRGGRGVGRTGRGQSPG